MIFNETFFVALAFVLFIALIFKPIGKFIVGALDSRSKRIQSELDEALRLKEEAQALLSSYQRKHKEASKEAERIIAKAEQEAKDFIEDAEVRLEESLNKRIEAAMQKIAGYEASVLQEVRSNAIDIAISAVRMLVVEHLSKEGSDELIAGAMKDIEKKLH